MFGLSADAHGRQPSGGFARWRMVRALLELRFESQEEGVESKSPCGEAHSAAHARAAKQPESRAEHPDRMPCKRQGRPNPEPESIGPRQSQVNQFLTQPMAFGIEADELEARAVSARSCGSVESLSSATGADTFGRSGRLGVFVPLRRRASCVSR